MVLPLCSVPRMLGRILSCPVQERLGHTGGSPAKTAALFKGLKHLAYEGLTEVGTVQPGEEEANSVYNYLAEE